MVCHHWSHIDNHHNHHCTHPIPLCDQGRVKLKLGKSKIGIFRTRYDNTESKWRWWQQLSASGQELLGEVVSAAGTIGRVEHRLLMSIMIFTSLMEASPLQNRWLFHSLKTRRRIFPPSQFSFMLRPYLTPQFPNKMQKSGGPDFQCRKWGEGSKVAFKKSLVLEGGGFTYYAIAFDISTKIVWM